MQVVLSNVSSEAPTAYPVDRVLSESTTSFIYDLSKGRPSAPYLRPPCPIFPGSALRFNYRFDGHATHQPLLHAAVLETTGDVVEFGIGHYSTPMLHALCEAMGRRLVSLDTDAAWVASFAHLAAPWHEFAVVASWDDADGGAGGDVLRRVYGQGWGVALVDQHPEAARVQVARRVKGRAELVVMHDANRQVGRAARSESREVGRAVRSESREVGRAVRSESRDGFVRRCREPAVVVAAGEPVWLMPRWLGALGGGPGGDGR